ncbi:basic-leucine zipper (bZIP) transcription factor [Aspergillus oryzae]|nr:basic-leucine zipper (bZIP) transcription factor [Aspergillus oryzae]
MDVTGAILDANRFHHPHPPLNSTYTETIVALNHLGSGGEASRVSCSYSAPGTGDAWGHPGIHLADEGANQGLGWLYDSHLLTASIGLTPNMPYTEQELEYQEAFHNGLFLNPPPGKSSSISRETGIIDPQRTSSFINISSPHPSESPVPGPLNFSTTSGSSSSLNNISTFDFTSFNTDHHQQTWLPTPPPQQPTAQNLNYNDNNSANSLQEDFVLYPQHPRDSRAPAPSSTTPRYPAYHPSLVRLGHLSRRQTLSLQQQQQQQLSASPVQVPRLTRLASQSTGFPLSSSHRFSPSTRKHLLRLRAASVASNSPPAVVNSAYPNRPPVPLFNSPANSTYQKRQQIPINHRRIMSTPNIAQDLPDFFDLQADRFGDDLVPTTEPTMLSPHQMTAGVMAGPDSLADLPSGTISPKDLFMDASAPPSASFTDLSTPSFESPGYFSQDTSPMFATDMELGPGVEEWGSLFPSQDDFSLGLDTTALDIAAALSQPKVKADVTPASPMIRTTSSRATSPSARSVTKPSHVAGVNARQRKPLPPIKFDSQDPVAMKRARNTEAARKSRARKLERQEEMQRRIDELEKSLEEAERREQYWKALAQNKA